MNSKEYEELVKMSRCMQSLVARLASKEHPISKDISDLRRHIVSVQLRTDYSLAAMSRALVVLQDQIGSIAQSLETLKSSVSVLQKRMEPDQEEMNWHPALLKRPVMEVEELPDSPMNSQERGTSPDITCSETIGLCKHQLIDQGSPVDGIMELQEWEKVEELMKNYETLM